MDKMQVVSLFEVLQKQGAYLPGQSGALIEVFNKIYAQSEELIKTHQPKCFMFMNESYDAFDVTFTVYDHQNKFHRFMEYELEFNDGESFGMEQDTYPIEVETYPTEDYFHTQRIHYLNKMFYEWFLECLWNSKLIQLDLPIIFSATSDCDELFDMKDGMMEYHDLDFLG